jgi:hypothetical protein
MKVKQISVFLENKEGRLSEVTSILAGGNINLRAVSIADTADFGILRIIAEKPDAALKLLKDAGFTARETDVIGIKMEDRPGTLAAVLGILEKNSVNIEYMYSTIMESAGKVVVIIRVENTDHCISIIEKEGMETINGF